MNGDYDLEGAAKQLDYLAGERRVNAISGIQLSRCTKATDWPNAYKIVQTKSFRRLVFAGTTSKDQENESPPNDLEEVVAHVQGIIWRHDLPPFRNRAITANRTKYLRQSVSLTGLGSPTFEAALKGVLDIYSLFSGHVPRDKLKGCACLDSFGEFTSIESSNRYFTSIRDCGPMEKHISFPSEIDPYGILTGLQNSNYIHSDNNIVEYYERTILETGEMKYTEISPARFQIGDIVEAQMTFMLVSLPGDEYKMVSILRSLTILDNSYSQRAFAAQAASKLLTNANATGKQTVKRKIGYANEERASRRSRLGEMEIDGADSENRPSEKQGGGERANGRGAGFSTIES